MDSSEIAAITAAAAAPSTVTAPEAAELEAAELAAVVDEVVARAGAVFTFLGDGGLFAQANGSMSITVAIAQEHLIKTILRDQDTGAVHL